MFLTQLDIRNFRGIEELSLPLDDLCVLIGENNSGKSTILDAICLCLTRNLTRKGSIFEEYDYHLADASADPSSAEPIEITLTFEEKCENEWPDDLSGLLSEAVLTNDDGLKSIKLQVTSQYNVEIQDYLTDYEFLDSSGEKLVRAKNPKLLFDLQRTIPAFYLASLRDAAQEFRARSKFWGPFVRAFQVDKETRHELESMLSELNKKVLDQHAAFEDVKDRLIKTAKLLPLDNKDPVSIEAVPSKIFDILSRTQVNLTSKTGAKIPILHHGSGTQSLAVISLFDAFLQNQLTEGYGDYAEPLLALEEPEAHLHPSAIGGVGEMLKQLSGQKLISTHSGELLAGVPLNNIFRLHRKQGKIAVRQMDPSTFTADEKNRLNYHVRKLRGSLLFSRCWLLVEGQTEATLLPDCARAMGYDLYAEGIVCVEFAQIGIGLLIKLANQLGIEWFAVMDNDGQGKKDKRVAGRLLDGRNPDNYIQMLDHGNMEVFLCMEGFGEIYKSTISDQAEGITEEEGSLDYWKQVLKSQKDRAKTRNAFDIAKNIANQGTDSVPELLQNVIRQTINLARDTG